VAGSSSWVGEFIGVQSKLSDAAPGTVLFVVGLAVVWLTRFAVRVKQPIDIELRARARVADRPEHERRERERLEHERRLHERRRKAG
jgi:hypothetical protein